MSTITKPRINLFAPFMQIFASGIDIESIDESKLDNEQREAQAKSDEIMSKSTGSITESTVKTNKKGGFAKRINQKTEAMRDIYDTVVKARTETDKERD